MQNLYSIRTINFIIPIIHSIVVYHFIYFHNISKTFYPSQIHFQSHAPISSSAIFHLKIPDHYSNHTLLAHSQNLYQFFQPMHMPPPKAVMPNNSHASVDEPFPQNSYYQIIQQPQPNHHSVQHFKHHQVQDLNYQYMSYNHILLS